VDRGPGSVTAGERDDRGFLRPSRGTLTAPSVWRFDEVHESDMRGVGESGFVVSGRAFGLVWPTSDLMRFAFHVSAAGASNEITSFFSPTNNAKVELAVLVPCFPSSSSPHRFPKIPDNVSLRGEFGFQRRKYTRNATSSNCGPYGGRTSYKKTRADGKLFNVSDLVSPRRNCIVRWTSSFP
jgi:hypothetical protein